MTHEDGDCPFHEGHEALLAILKKADKTPLVVETWICPKCGIDCWESHAFRETVSCAKCNHHVASKVPRYRDMLNMLPDLMDNDNRRPKP